MTVNVQDADVTKDNNVKKIITLIILFIIFTMIVNTCPAVTQWDRSVIISIQNYLQDIPVIIPLIAGTWLYFLLIFIPVVIGIIYFFRNYLLIDMLILPSAPLVAYLFNKIFKVIIQRPRPHVDMQLIAHKPTFSYVSNHTFITCALWGLIIYYVIKYCNNKFIKIFVIIFGILWMAFEGFSRIWLGVHNPRDVIGSYILAFILLLVYIKLIRLIGGKC